MERLKVGCVFVGNVNNHLFELVEIEKSNKYSGQIAIVKDITTDQRLMYGYEALCHLDITIIKEGV